MSQLQSLGGIKPLAQKKLALSTGQSLGPSAPQQRNWREGEKELRGQGIETPMNCRQCTIPNNKLAWPCSQAASVATSIHLATSQELKNTVQWWSITHLALYKVHCTVNIPFCASVIVEAIPTDSITHLFIYSISLGEGSESKVMKKVLQTM